MVDLKSEIIEISDDNDVLLLVIEDFEDLYVMDEVLGNVIDESYI